jgi:CheY-like chemotaxis protein
MDNQVGSTQRHNRGEIRVRPKKTILCVDDNEQILSVRKFLLETVGYRVLAALSAEEALIVFREGGIDLVVTDLTMPNMDGNELIRQMKQIDPEVAVIAISGIVESFDRASHADAFLPKGSSTRDLIERVKVLALRKRGPKPRSKRVTASEVVAVVKTIEGAA